MIRVVGYIRVSTQGQVRDGYSLSYQRDEIMRYCAENEIELVEINEVTASAVPWWTKRNWMKI